jgi:hypothetical protein
MKTRVFMLAAAVALCAPAAASAATVPVQQLNGPFAASNSTVTKTPDGGFTSAPTPTVGHAAR